MTATITRWSSRPGFPMEQRTALRSTGCDFLVYDEDGRIVDFMMMVRPLKAAHALADRMSEHFADIEKAAIAWARES